MKSRGASYPKYTDTDMEDMRIGVNNIIRRFPVVAKNNFTLKPIIIKSGQLGNPYKTSAKKNNYINVHRCKWSALSSILEKASSGMHSQHSIVKYDCQMSRDNISFYVDLEVKCTKLTPCTASVWNNVRLLHQPSWWLVHLQLVWVQPQPIGEQLPAQLRWGPGKFHTGRWIHLLQER